MTLESFPTSDNKVTKEANFISSAIPIDSEDKNYRDTSYKYGTQTVLQIRASASRMVTVICDDTFTPACNSNEDDDPTE